MSRCFPYPPPGCSRNGATYEALIESIKLQKESTKPKSELKKEKKAKKGKREKRQKTNENSEYEVKLQKNSTGFSHMVLQKAVDQTNAIIEPFEKSDLTEEYGQPSGQYQPTYSSDSTQNSNKRKRDVSSLLHDSSISDGKGKPPIKIRLLKHKDSDSSNFTSDVRSNSHSSKSNLIPCRENRIQTKSKPIFEESKISDSNRLHFCRLQSVSRFVKPINPSVSNMSVVERHQSARTQLPILRFERQVPSSCLEHEIPSSFVSTHVEQEFDPCRQQQQFAPSHHGTSTSVVAKRFDHEDQHKTGLTRHEKKMLKKHLKYEKLLGSLFSPVFQSHLPDDDDDWLSRSKTAGLTVSKCEVETCRQLVEPWQPCALYLAEVDMHALPYTIPF